MNYFKSAEQILSSVPTLEKSLNNLEMRKQRLIDSGMPMTVGSINYEKSFTNSQYVSDTLNDLLAVSECVKNINDTKLKLDEINRIILQLPDEYQKIIRLWYIKKTAKEKIANEMYIESITTVYNLRNRAVAEFALLYFGAGALNSI